jgi:DNA-binding MarR family transcriptional regulator
VSEVSEKQREIEALIDALDGIWEKGGNDVPEWVAQELTFGQMRLLFLLHKNGPAPMSRVAEWLGVSLPTASGTVERVERHGLVERQHRRDDRRVVECRLTEEGQRLIGEISGTRLEMMRSLLSVLSDDELTDMARLVKVIVERVGPRMIQTTSPPAESQEQPR